MSSRREFLSALVAALSTGYGQMGADEKQSSKESAVLSGLHGSEQVAILIYPGFTALDVFGPHHFLTSMMGAKVHLVAESKAPMKTDTGIEIRPTMSFAECPDKLTVLMVPGGTVGTLAAAENKMVRDFLKTRGAAADWVCSVCTGSLVLGAAGLLEGYRATSHWIVRDQLKLFNAFPTDQRVVVDRNRITGAGVTAGLDFGLSLVNKLRGKEYASAVQLFSEYDPHPPLNSGNEHVADPGTVVMLRGAHVQFRELVEKTARETQPK